MVDRILRTRFFRGLNSREKERAEINTWKEHYRKLWYSDTIPVREDTSVYAHGLGYLILEDLIDALSGFKNKKVRGNENINVELLKYFRYFLNTDFYTS